jgi:hypothetical protein
MSTAAMKKEVTNAANPLVLKTTPVNKTHAIYLFVKQYPGLTYDEYRVGLTGRIVKLENDSTAEITNTDVYVALRDFTANGRMNSVTRGRGKHKSTTYEINPDMEYKPVMRKIQKAARKTMVRSVQAGAPNQQQSLGFNPSIITDPIVEKAPKTSQPSPVTDISTHRAKKAKDQKFEMIEGMAAIDPNHPEFQEVAKELLSKVTPVEVPMQEGPIKPILDLMFFNVGSQSVAATPRELRQLYDELHAIFGK